MSATDLYFKFVISLAAGLVGVGLLLTTLFETLLRDWDPARDLRRWWRLQTATRSQAAAIRAEDILRQIDRGAAIPGQDFAERRRELLREVRAVDDRLAASASS